MREGEGHVRQRFRDQLADAQFVGGIDDRPEQTDSDRLHLQVPTALECGANTPLMQRDEDIPFGVDSLLDLECEVTRDVRRWIRDLPEGVQFAAFP